MSHISSEAVGSICEHYSDVIEGGTTWRGSGTSFRGIPGTYSNDPGLRSAADTPLTSTGSAATTTFAVSGGSWESSRWVKADTPGFFAVCTSATNAQNVDAARRITGWNNTTKVATLHADLHETPDSTTTYLIGFNQWPIKPLRRATDYTVMPTPAPLQRPQYGTILNRTVWFDSAPDKVYGIWWEYWAALDMISETGALFTHFLRRWRSLFIQGIAVKTMQRYDDDRYVTELAVYKHMLDRFEASNAVCGQVVFHDV